MTDIHKTGAVESHTPPPDKEALPSLSSDELTRLNQEVSRLTALLIQYEADVHLIDQLSQTLGVGFSEEKQLYETIFEQINAILPLDTFLIVLAEPGTTMGHFVLIFDEGVHYSPRHETLGPLLRWIVERSESLVFDDVYPDAQEQFEHLPINYGQGEKRSRSWLGVPMMVRGQVKGVMSVQSYQPALYGDREQRLLGVIASQSAVAIENAQLFRQVQNTLEQLSTPIVPVFEGVLILPLIGAIDAQRATRIIESLLTGIEEHSACVVIIDITGVPSMDTQIAQALMQAARAARLLGTETVLTGIRPEVAEIVVTLGVDLSALVTRSTLQTGIEYALEAIERIP